MEVTRFRDEALKRGFSIEDVKCTFESDFEKEKTFGTILSNKTETICFKPQEIESLISELSSGKLSLKYLSAELNLTIYQTRLGLEFLLKTNKIEGELTITTFISKKTLKKRLN
jgi:hypothetical protein